MNEGFPPKENSKNPEIEELLKTYPIPEKYKDRMELALRLKKIIRTLLEQDMEKNQKNMYDFGLKLQNKYKDASQHYLYNVFIGSSYSEGERVISEFDFPGEDSIERFLRLRELPNKLDD